MQIRLPGRATLGPFLLDRDENLYGIISQHVKKAMVVTEPIAIFASNGSKVRAFLYSKDTIYDVYDISIVKLNSLKVICQSVFLGKNGTVADYNLYNGSAGELVGKEVFHRSTASGTDRVMAGTVIEPPYEAKPGHFFVKGLSGQFSRDGDSGGAVVMEVGEGKLSIVGIIVGGDETFCYCLLLQKGIEILNWRFDLDLELKEQEQLTRPVLIKPGVQYEFPRESGQVQSAESGDNMLQIGFRCCVIFAALIITTGAHEGLMDSAITLLLFLDMLYDWLIQSLFLNNIVNSYGLNVT